MIWGMLGIFFIAIILAWLLGSLVPVKKGIDIKRIGRKYSLRMESNGGLRDTDIIEMKEEIGKLGMDINQITIHKITKVGEASYGEMLTLKFDVKYIQSIIDMSNPFRIKKSVETYTFSIDYKTTSKKDVK